MSSTVSNGILRLRIDEDLKKEAIETANAMGLTVSDAVRMFLVRFVADKRFPFLPEVPNETTLAAMKEAEAGEGKVYKNVDDFFKEMDI